MEKRVPEEEIWVALAELFFLDTEPDDLDFQRVAELLKSAAWDSVKTQEFLVKYVAPNAGSNLGYLIYPVIGEWAKFDEEKLCRMIQRSLDRRRGKPDWYFLLSDWWSKKMLKTLSMDRLLEKL